MKKYYTPANASEEDLMVKNKFYNKEDEFKAYKVYTNKKIYYEVEKEISRRIKFKKFFNESEVKYQTIFENSGTAIVLYNEKGTLLMFNHEFEKISGYSKDELEDKRNWREFIHKDDLAKINEYNRLIFTDPNQAPNSYETRLVDNYGIAKDVILNMAMIPGEKLVLASLVDITERKKAERLLEESLKEKEILLREIHHRVKNNMQIISSLLNLQGSCVVGEETIDVLKDSQGRVKSMAMVHENLYQSPTLSDINFKPYIENLIKDILNSYGIQEGTIKTKLEIDEIRLDIDTAIPCGLIINELVTNSVKYAFPQGKGTITIKLKSSSDEVELTIADNGIGIPKDFDYKNIDSLGLQLVNILVKQLNGKITLERSQGTRFKIKFNNEIKTKRI